MTSIGGKIGRRGFSTPDNQGMVNRANKRLESQVSSANARLNNALAVDGVKILVWRRRPEGGPVCSCHADVAKEDRQAASAASNGGATAEDVDGYEIVGHKHPSHSEKPDITSHNFDNPLDDIDFAPRKRAVDVGTDPLTGHAIDEIDFEDTSEPTEGGAAPANPLGSHTAAGVACPVCAGATYRDGWQPHNGHRAVMSFLAADSFTTTAMVDDTTKPFCMVLAPGQTIQWDLKLPRLFCEVVRFGMWSGRSPLLGDDYPIEVFDGLGWKPATPKALLAMNNDKKFTFRLTPRRRVIITHFDCIVLLSDNPMGQFPPLNAPNDAEFREYLTNITIEVGANIKIEPGDLLSDYKFFKMWSVTNAARKFTNGGRALASSLDLRVVTSTEASFSLHPFDRYEENGDKPFASKLEAFQGNS